MNGHLHVILTQLEIIETIMMIVFKNLARESSFRHFITNGKKRLLPNQLSWQDEIKDFTCAWGFKATSIRVSGKLKRVHNQLYQRRQAQKRSNVFLPLDNFSSL